MKQMCALILALSSAGCIEVERQEFDDLHNKVDTLELKLKQNNDLQVHLYNELVQKHAGLTKQVTELDMLLRTQQAGTARLEERVKTLEAMKPGIVTGGGDGPPQVPTVKPQDIQLHVQTTLGELRQGKRTTDEAASLLRPYSAVAAPDLLHELARATTQIDYSKQLESILAKFPPADLKDSLQKALTQRGLRESAARVVGQAKDAELGRILETHTDTADEDFRLLVGESLVLCRNGKGIPILVVSLRSGEATTRTIALATLKRLARGQDFGYRAQLSNEQNAEALKSWQEWFEKGGKTIFDP